MSQRYTVGKLPSHRADQFLRGTEENTDTEEISSPAANTAPYTALIALGVAAGLFFAYRSAFSETGEGGLQAALSLGFAALVSIIRPSKSSGSNAENNQEGITALPSIASLTAREWQERYERDNKVSLWVEDDFSANTRAKASGIGTGEGPSQGNVPVHRVRMTDREGKEWDLQVPEDRYILWEAEDQGMKLPFACRVGCCTTCAVKISEGVMVQDQALGIAREFREQGYGLMCVGYPKSDVTMALIEEDELYEKQFGEYFAKNATNPKAPGVVRDDFALEIAMGDE